MLFYITGPDSYRAQQKLQELKDKFIKEVDTSGLNLATVDGEKLSATDLPHLLSTASFIAKRRCVVIKRLLSSKDKDLAKVVPRLLGGNRGAEDHIVIFFEPDEPSAKNPLHKWLKEHAHTQFFPLLTGAALKKYVADEAKRHDRAITSGAVQLLCERGRQDLCWIMQDLKKCHDYLEAGAPIDETVVKELTTPAPMTEVFPLVDAVLRADMPTAAPWLMDYLESGESPQMLIGLLESQLRTL